MKTVVVTGASSGIGEEIAKHMCTRGWQVLAVARTQDKLVSLSEVCDNVKAFPCNLTQPDQIEELGAKLTDYKINALINNAGIYHPQSVDQDDDSVWETHFQANLMSAIRTTRVLWENLKDNNGCVLNISSTLAIRPIPSSSAYSALKAAMNNWTLSLAIEGAPHGVRANAICPGIVDTPIHSYYGSEKPEDRDLHETLQKAQPLGRTGRVTDIAPMALQLCSDESQWITGNILNIDGGILLNS